MNTYRRSSSTSVAIVTTSALQRKRSWLQLQSKVRRKSKVEYLWCGVLQLGQEVQGVLSHQEDHELPKGEGTHHI